MWEQVECKCPLPRLIRKGGEGGRICASCMSYYGDEVEIYDGEWDWDFDGRCAIVNVEVAEYISLHEPQRVPGERLAYKFRPGQLMEAIQFLRSDKGR